jgi:hypothetical protein
MKEEFCCNCDSYSKHYEFEGKKQIEVFLDIHDLSQYYGTFINEGFDRILSVIHLYYLIVYSWFVIVVRYNRI